MCVDYELDRLTEDAYKDVNLRFKSVRAKTADCRALEGCTASPYTLPHIYTLLEHLHTWTSSLTQNILSWLFQN